MREILEVLRIIMSGEIDSTLTRKSKVYNKLTRFSSNNVVVLYNLTRK